MRFFRTANYANYVKLFVNILILMWFCYLCGEGKM